MVDVGSSMSFASQTRTQIFNWFQTLKMTKFNTLQIVKIKKYYFANAYKIIKTNNLLPFVSETYFVI